MRATLWILALFALFGAAWLLQARWRRAAAAELGRTELSAPPDGWSRAVIGRPSGVEPVNAESSARPAEAPTISKNEPPAAVRTDSLRDDSIEAARHVVVLGETLTSICADHYGSRSAKLVEALARYNGLADASTLSVGRTILLPSKAVLER